jgi:hypothetical protein
MANRGRATFAKRQREIARQERAREKAAKRVERKTTWIKPDREGEVDPDIAGIVPGPQPLPYDLPEEEVPAAEEGGDEDEQDT